MRSAFHPLNDMRIDIVVAYDRTTRVAANGDLTKTMLLVDIEVVILLFDLTSVDVEYFFG